MLERCQRISRSIRPGKEVFFASEELQDAVIRNIEVIGEAAKRVPLTLAVAWVHWIGKPSAACGMF